MNIFLCQSGEKLVGRPSSPRPSPPRRGGNVRRVLEMSCCRVEDGFNERGKIATAVQSWVGDCNPFRVVEFGGRFPRVAPASQPWADGRNPIGVRLAEMCWQSMGKSEEKLVGRPSSPRPSPPRRGGNVRRVSEMSRCRVEDGFNKTVKVAPASQFWADGWNPVGVRLAEAVS